MMTEKTFKAAIDEMLYLAEVENDDGSRELAVGIATNSDAIAKFGTLACVLMQALVVESTREIAGTKLSDAAERLLERVHSRIEESYRLIAAPDEDNVRTEIRHDE